MKVSLLFLLLSIVSFSGTAQSSSSVVEITTVYSQNEKFYLRSIPYDNEEPSLRGKTTVYQTGTDFPLYSFDLGFDSVIGNPNRLILSNDGETIFYVGSWRVNKEDKELISVSFFRKGQLVKGFTAAQITGCDYQKERCGLLYPTYDLVDKKASNWGTANYKRVLRSDISEKEAFLGNFSIFSDDNTVYLIDAQKKVHLFDLKQAVFIRSELFENIFDYIRSKGRSNRSSFEEFKSPLLYEFPKLADGKSTEESLAAYLGMKTVEEYTNRDDKYKQYRFYIKYYLLQNGRIEVDKIESYDDIPTDKIKEFLQSQKFDGSFIPEAIGKWYSQGTHINFRNKNNKIARREKQQQLAEYREEAKRNEISESLNGVYIPKDLADCFTQLDKLLSPVRKDEIKAATEKDMAMEYSMGLGLWMRNNWRLWGTSRLQKYFVENGVSHPEEMSSIILERYQQWLNGKTDTAKDWENRLKQ